MTPVISVVIPAYEEEKNLPVTLNKVVSFLSSNNKDFEIIIVDDGSRDRTSDIAREILKDVPHLILTNDTNHGKGYCVRKGMLAASGQYVLFTDADLSTPIEELNRMLPYLEDGFDVVIGSRALEEKGIRRNMLWYREIMGRTYNLFVQILLFPGILDSQCGFKCFKHNVARELFAIQKLNSFSFDGEILFLARKKGFRVKELAVNWYQSPTSKVKLIKDSVRMFLELVQIRMIHRN